MGKCHKVSLHIQNLHLQLNCISLPLKEVGMVLDADYLASSRTYSTNIQNKYMKLKWKGNKYQMYGLRSSPPKHK